MYDDFFVASGGKARPNPSAARKGKGKAMPLALKSEQENDEEEEDSPKRPSKVRFHDEVRVKMIKAHGNLASLYHDEDEDDEDEDDLMKWGMELGDDDDDDDNPGYIEDDDQGSDDDEDREEDEEDDHGEGGEEEEGDGFETMERFKDDLFGDEEHSDAAKQGLFLCKRYWNVLAHTDALFPDLSAHQKRQLALQEQISQLEQENIAKKDWTLMGEANSRVRPVNSLLEEDLEFEHNQRVVPVITEDKIKFLEELIKARILEVCFIPVVAWSLTDS